MNGPIENAPALRASAVAPLVWAAIAVAAGLSVATLDPNLLEEGIVVHTAQRMSEGEHLYRDVAIHTGPLPYELLALLFRLFGPHILIARGVVALLQGAATAALFAGARRAGAGAFAHAAAAVVAAAPVLMIPLFSIFYYTTIAFYLGLMAVYAGLRTAESRAWAVTAGVLVAAVALCKQNTGVQFALFFLTAVALCVPRGRRLRRVGAMTLGGGSVALLTLMLYLARGDLSQLLYAQVTMPFVLASAETFRTPYINLWPPGELDPVVRDSWLMYLPALYHMKYGLWVEISRGAIAITQLLYALPIVAVAATALRAALARIHPLVWIHGAFSIAMTAGLYPRADWGHLVVALPPAVVQLLLLASGGGEAHRPRRGTSRWIAVGFTAIFATSTAGVAGWLHSIAGPPVFGPRVPFRPVSRALREPAVPRVIRYLRARARAGEAIFVPRMEPLVYFATNTRNPTPFEGVLPGLRDWQQPAILAALEDVRFVVMSDVDQPTFTYYSDELPAVWAYFERYFRFPADYPVDDYNWIMVFERGPDRGQTAIDFVAERASGRAWVRTSDGHVSPAPGWPRRFAARQLRRPLPISLGPGGGGIDFDVEIPEEAVFQAGVGYRHLVAVDEAYVHPPGTTVAVSIRSGGDFETLVSRRIDDGLRAGRRWTPIEADLSRYAARRVTLRLEFLTERPLPDGALSWFGSPRIATRPPGDAR